MEGGDVEGGDVDGGVEGGDVEGGSVEVEVWRCGGVEGGDVEVHIRREHHYFLEIYLSVPDRHFVTGLTY